MKSEPDEIHFDCPQCKRPMSGDKALLGEMIHCPDCLEPFYVTLRKPEPKSEPKPEPAKPDIRLECPKCHHAVFVEKKAMLYEYVTCQNCAANFSTELTKGREKIRNQADRFTVAAGLFCGIGLLIAIASLAQAISGEEGAGKLFIVAASLIGASLWFYLIAQIIHIRANTEK